MKNILSAQLLTEILLQFYLMEEKQTELGTESNIRLLLPTE